MSCTKTAAGWICPVGCSLPTSALEVCGSSVCQHLWNHQCLGPHEGCTSILFFHWVRVRVRVRAPAEALPSSLWTAGSDLSSSEWHSGPPTAWPLSDSHTNQHAVSTQVLWNQPSVQWSSGQRSGWKPQKPTLANLNRKGIHWLDIGELRDWWEG